VPHLLVSLGGILGDILRGILVFLVVFFISETATSVAKYCSFYLDLGLYV
jgi:hypothetical protein